MQNLTNPFDIRPAHRVNQVSEYYFSRKLKEIAGLNAQGLDIISLGIGGPDRPPHADTIEALCSESRRPDTHSYQPYVGIPELRQAFADWYARWYGVELDPQREIQPLIGSKEGILHISLAFLNPGDGVLVPNPGYPTYSSVSRLAEAEIFTYDLDGQNGWQPDFEQIESLPLDRIKLIRGLRTGEFDVLVGINLLREGLDMPEVALVAILDADKEGFLRSETSLIQTIGRAARNVDGRVIMYADSITPSMERAIQETERRRAIQSAYNEAHGIVPKTIVKTLSDNSVLEISRKGDDDSGKRMSRAECQQKIERLTREMKEAAKILEFEHAAFLRDRIEKLRKQMESKTKL